MRSALARNAAPTVTLLSFENSPWTNLTTMALLPTPVSPRSTSFTRVSRGTPGIPDAADSSLPWPGADGPDGALMPRSKAAGTRSRIFSCTPSHLELPCPISDVRRADPASREC